MNVCLCCHHVFQAFSETQKKRLVSWKQQVLKILRLFPRKAMLDMPLYRQKGYGVNASLTHSTPVSDSASPNVFFIHACTRRWAYGSNSLPTAGSVSGGVSRRGQRQFTLPPRGAPLSGRMGIVTHSPRHTLATQPGLTTQGRQVSVCAHIHQVLNKFQYVGRLWPCTSYVYTRTSITWVSIQK